MWVEITSAESCQLLRAKVNTDIYSIPSPMELYYSPADIGDVIYYYRTDDTPYVKISRGFNDRGFWGETYFKWVKEEV